MCTQQATFSTAPLAANAEPLRVLLVDDQDDVLNMMNLLMQRRSYTVATANSGPRAIEVADGFAPHIVVSDIAMPEMDGYEMLDNLRANKRLTPFKAIALSGYDEAENERATSAGFDAHLTKPVDFNQLFETINRLFDAAQDEQ